MADKCEICGMETNYFNTNKFEGGAITCTGCYSITAHFYKKGYLVSQDIHNYNQFQKQYETMLNSYLLVVKKLSIHNKILFRLLLKRVNRVENDKAIEVFKKERQFLTMSQHVDLLTLILDNRFFDICPIPDADTMADIKLGSDRKEISQLYNAHIHAKETGLVTFSNY